MKNKTSILVVDDNKDILYSVKEGLASLKKNYEVTGALSGRKALDILKRKIPDLILLDIMMPGMDGWDVCAHIKSSRKTEDIPIVFLTAKTDLVSKNLGMLAAADYIEKPFEIRDLDRRIHSTLKKQRHKK